MKFTTLTILILLLFSFVPPIFAQNEDTLELTDEEIELLFGYFKEIRGFGIISLSLLGDAEKVGLDESQLDAFLYARFDAYFCNTQLQDLSLNPARLAAAIANRDKTVGIITFRVWVIGEEYPLAYHVKCDAGSFENPSIWTEEVLGHGSKKNAPETIKEILDELMQQLANNFLKARGEKCSKKF
jgi:hypothetical protein